jgi:hypothetical protein
MHVARKFTPLSSRHALIYSCLLAFVASLKTDHAVKEPRLKEIGMTELMDLLNEVHAAVKDEEVFDKIKDLTIQMDMDSFQWTKHQEDTLVALREKKGVDRRTMAKHVAEYMEDLQEHWAEYSRKVKTGWKNIKKQFPPRAADALKLLDPCMMPATAPVPYNATYSNITFNVTVPEVCEHCKPVLTWFYNQGMNVSMASNLLERTSRLVPMVMSMMPKIPSSVTGILVSFLDAGSVVTQGQAGILKKNHEVLPALLREKLHCKGILGSVEGGALRAGRGLFATALAVVAMAGFLR